MFCRASSARTTGRCTIVISAFVLAGVLITGCAGVPPEVESYPAESAHWVEIDDVRIHYFDFYPEAQDTPILWIHGYSGTAFETFYIKDHLGPGRRIIAPDLPGSGLSAKPDIEYTLEYFVDFLDEFVEAMALEEYILVGHSMGGMIASALAAEQASGLDRLILIAPYGLKGEAGVIPEFLAETGALVDVGLELHNETLLELAVRYNVFHRNDRIPQDFVDYLSYSTFKTENAIPALASVTRNVIASAHDPSVLNRIEVKTLIIWGSEDRVLDFRYSATFNRRIADSVLQAVPDCGHLPHVERPEVTAGIINRFLE